jgi:hypothetical protein
MERVKCNPHKSGMHYLFPPELLKKKGQEEEAGPEFWCNREETEGSNANRFRRRRGRETPGVEEEDISIISTASRIGSAIR